MDTSAQWTEELGVARSIGGRKLVSVRGQKEKEQLSLECPRCKSSNTKFCYYNNYSLSQPRYLCKTCRRYWTQGGTLRNVPVGGTSRKIINKTPAPAPISHDLNLDYSHLNPPNIFASSSTSTNFPFQDCKPSLQLDDGRSLMFAYKPNNNNNEPQHINHPNGSFWNINGMLGAGGSC